ncbi:MAG: hypothetical protein KatS3mg060_1760 [Dehalococcoidia bacterium]|nr:MAG: hypothetical protein KatS3mg060_1760 [Dehalococcoidia bacterium]
MPAAEYHATGGDFAACPPASGCADQPMRPRFVMTSIRPIHHRGSRNFPDLLDGRLGPLSRAWPPQLHAHCGRGCGGEGVRGTVRDRGLSGHDRRRATGGVSGSDRSVRPEGLHRLDRWRRTDGTVAEEVMATPRRPTFVRGPCAAPQRCGARLAVFQRPIHVRLARISASDSGRRCCGWITSPRRSAESPASSLPTRLEGRLRQWS